jgi:hypothetical protein
MSSRRLCTRLAGWCALYPNPQAAPDENATARADEDRRLARFAGLDALTLAQTKELIGWKFASMPHRRARALEGVAPDRWKGRSGARDLIRRALASDDDVEALALIVDGGIFRFGPAMGSALLAACRPERFTVADANALRALRTLGLMPPGPVTFGLKDWPGYLDACRKLAAACRMSLRDVDRGLWVAGATM